MNESHGVEWKLQFRWQLDVGAHGDAKFPRSTRDGLMEELHIVDARADSRNE